MKRIFIISIVIALAVLIYYAYANTAAPAPQTDHFALVVKGRTLVQGPSMLAVRQGDAVSITITVDEDEEVHLHGYNIMTDVTKGVPATFTFTATDSGRFPFELEKSSTELGEVDVEP